MDPIVVADDVEGLADEVLPGGKDTVSICLITGFESFNVSLYNQVRTACNWEKKLIANRHSTALSAVVQTTSV